MHGGFNHSFVVQLISRVYRADQWLADKKINCFLSHCTTFARLVVNEKLHIRELSLFLRAHNLIDRFIVTLINALIIVRLINHVN